MDNYKDMPTESFKDFCELCADCLGGETKKADSYTAYRSPGSFWYNRNFIETKETDRIISSVNSIKADIPKGFPFIVSYTKYDDSESADNTLLKEGYPLFVNQTGMNFDLSKNFPVPDDKNIVLIDNDQIEEWSNTVSTAFGKPEDLATFRAVCATGKCRIYAYMEDGKIIGTAMTYTKNGNCGIHEVSVLGDHRGKGIAKNLILKNLTDAKNEGAKVASLQASALGEPLYASIGFETVSIISTYMKLPPH